MRHVTFYHLQTGLLNGVSLLCSDDAAVALNVPKDHAPIDHPPGAQLDHRCQRVDLSKIAAEDDARATEWKAVLDNNRLRRTTGATVEDPPAPPRTLAALRHVVDYQPPAPGADHEWNAAARRWELTAAESKRRARQALARSLESQQHGLVRRLVLDLTDADARAKLKALHDEIAGLSSQEGE